MSYPPTWRHASDLDAALRLMSAYPFALVTSANETLKATRVPFATDVTNGRPARLRGHLNVHNPQCADLEGADVLVVFLGPSTYVSPHWRKDKTRAGTFDYEEVQVRGRAHVVSDINFFRQLIDDLSALLEPQNSGVGDYPVWQTHMAPAGYIERLFPQVLPFWIDIEAFQTVAKLHQQFPEEDRRSVAAHLARSPREDSRIIADRIRRTLGA